MIVAAIGFVAGVGWTLGAFVTMNRVAWTGPTSLALIGWPAILAHDILASRR